MGWTIGVRIPAGTGIFLFTTPSRTALGHTQPPIQWVPGDLSLGVKRRGREAHHSPQSNAEVQNAWSYTSTPQYAFMAWYSVKRKHRDNFLSFLIVLFYLAVSRGFYLWIYRQLVGLLWGVIGPTQGLYLHTGQHNTEKRRHISMPRRRFEPAISTFERSKTVLASDRSTIETGSVPHHQV
jgi:hypothetical protein